MTMPVDPAVARAKARKQAREARAKARGEETEEEGVVRAKSASRARQEAEATDGSQVPLMIGDVVVGKMNIHSTGQIIARISPSAFGMALAAAIKNGELSAIQLAPGFLAELKPGINVVP